MLYGGLENLLFVVEAVVVVGIEVCDNSAAVAFSQMADAIFAKRKNSVMCLIKFTYFKKLKISSAVIFLSWCRFTLQKAA